MEAARGLSDIIYRMKRNNWSGSKSLFLQYGSTKRNGETWPGKIVSSKHARGPRANRDLRAQTAMLFRWIDEERSQLDT